MATLHTGCGREVHHGGCTCREGAEIAALKAEVERLVAHGECVRRSAVIIDNANSETIENLHRQAHALRADLAAHQRALAAGPAALRALPWRPTRPPTELAALVEAAQEAAMKKGT